jgi:hypothetical protein
VFMFLSYRSTRPAHTWGEAYLTKGLSLAIPVYFVRT